MGWGLTYTGQGQIHEVAEAIEEVAEWKGMIVRRECPEPDKIVIHLTQTAPWHRIVLRALPQRIRWTLLQTDRAFEVTLDVQYARWYVALILVQCLLATGLLIGAFRLTDTGGWARQEAPTIALSVCMLFMGMATWFVGLHLIGAIGGKRTIEFWHSIRNRVECEERLLEAKGSTHGRRFIIIYLSYLSYLVIVMACMFAASGGVRLPDDWLLSAVVALLCVCVAFLIISLPLIWRNPHLDARIEPILPGLCTIAGTGLLLGAQAPWFIARPVGAVEPVAVVESAGAFLAEKPLHMSERAYAELRQSSLRFAGTVRSWGFSCTLGSFFIALMSVGLLANALTISVHTWPLRQRLTRFREHRTLRGTITGSAFIRSLRVVFLTPWSLISLLMLLAISYIVGSTVHALVGAYPGDAPGAAAQSVNASILMVSAALGHPEGHSGIEILVRAVWVVYGSLCLTVLGLSVGQLLRTRHRTLQRLQSLAATVAPNPGRAASILGQLADKAGCRPPQLAIRVRRDDNDEPPLPSYGHSHQFGLFRRQRFIEMSSPCLRLLDDEELEAVLAHELAHLIRGHGFVDNLLRMLGRLTFVGDQAVRVFQLTVGYELDADRVAVEKLGADPDALIHCLWKIRNVRAAEGASALDGTGALALLSGHDRADIDASTFDVDSLPFKVRWRLALRLFLWQYTSASKEGSMYWHPSIDRRVKALRGMTGRRPRRLRPA